METINRRPCRIGSLVKITSVWSIIFSLTSPGNLCLAAPATSSGTTSGTTARPHSNQPILAQASDEKPDLRGLQNTPSERKEMEELADETTRTSGAIFVSPEMVLVKAPVLSALITLNEQLQSPYTLEASSQKDITLKEALTTAKNNNLDIKISATDVDINKWNYIGSIGGFLPSISNDYQMQALTGDYASPSGISIPIKNLYLTSSNGYQMYLYKGGSILHTALKNKHNYSASKFALKGTISDVLLDTSSLYYDLVLNDVLLQIRVKSVEVGKGLVLLNKDLFEDGVNTQLDVLQSEYELSRNRQDLISQQIARRESAVKLATALNLNPNQDFVIDNRLVYKARLVDPKLKINDLLTIAVDNRPELKRYEQLRLAAKEQIKVARAALLPSLSTTGAIIGTSTRASSVNFSDGSTSLSSSGAGVGAVSGASSLPLSGSSSGTAKKWTAKSLYVIGLDLQWNIGGMAVTEIAQIQAARAEARKVQLEFNRSLNQVYQQVHDAYLSSIGAENLIVETTAAVKAAEESLRVAELRFTEGVGTYLDVIQAQRNYTAALISKAQALIAFNTSQTKLVHALGRVSVDSMSTPYIVR